MFTILGIYAKIFVTHTHTLIIFVFVITNKNFSSEIPTNLYINHIWYTHYARPFYCEASVTLYEDHLQDFL